MARRAVTEETTGATPSARLTGATLDPPSWGSRFAGPFASVRMAAIGLRRTFGLLAVVSLGMLAAIALICTVPLYTRLVSETQLHQTLTTQRPADLNIEVSAQAVAIQPSAAESAVKQSDSLAQRWIGDFIASSMSFLQGNGRMRITALNGVEQRERPGFTSTLPHDSLAAVYGFDMRQAGPHMHLFAGCLPQDNPADGVPGVLITNRMANVNPGDTLTLQVSGYLDQIVTVRVVGIWYPNDETEAFWNGHSFDTVFLDDPPVFPILFSTNGFTSALAFNVQAGERPLGMVVHDIYYTDPSRISADRIAATITNVKTLRAQLNGNLLGRNGVNVVAVQTSLDKILAALQDEFALLALPLYVVAAQLVGLALLFVFVMAGVLVDRRQVEIATLKSRGASTAQLLISYGLQGVLLATLSAVVAPLLAATLSLTLVRTFVPSSVELLNDSFGERYVMSAAASQAVLLPALAGAALSIAAVLAAALRAARLDVLALRREQGRSTAVPFWKRYYLDVGLVALCAVGYVELGQFGGLNVRAALSGTGGASTSPDLLLVAAPGLLLLAGALLVLRLFPLAAQAGAGLASRGRGATAMLAFAQVARAGNAFARLTLLLTLAVGLGLFALTFQASLAQNAADRAAYLAGSDELARLVPDTPNTLALRDRYAHLPGVLAATPVLRTTARSVDQVGVTAQVLAVDSSSFASVARWRDDYATAPLATLMAGMQSHLRGSRAGDADDPLWALVDPAFAATVRVGPGDRFNLASNQVAGSPIAFVVGGVVTYFPTMFDGQFSGFLVVDMNEYLTAVSNQAVFSPSGSGPNEYWLRTTSDLAGQAALAKALADANLLVSDAVSRPALASAFLADPLAAGMTGLLLVGAMTAAALATVGGIVQSILSARLRVRDFAIMRTLGTSAGQLLRMLLGEQVIVYLFGLASGTLLGLALSTATLPFLQFSSSLTNPDQAGVPPYVLIFNLPGAATFYAVLLGAFVVALLLAARVAVRVGLGRTLRLGED